MRRFGRQDTASGVSHISQTHSRRDPFADDYGLWPFDDRDYDILRSLHGYEPYPQYQFVLVDTAPL